MAVPYKINIYEFIDRNYADLGGSKKFIELYNKTRPIEIAIHFNLSQRTIDRWIKEHRELLNHASQTQ